MSTFTEYTNLTYVTEQCFDCGVFFAMESRFHSERKTHGYKFYCPNGHSQIYKKSEVQALKEQLEQKERELRASKCETLGERQLREKSERKLERVSRGVCPCCQRHFVNLARHMATKHPEAKST